MKEFQIIIRIWRNVLGVRNFLPGIRRTGHVSLQICDPENDDIYISFWPIGSPTRNNYIERREGSFIENFGEDYVLIKNQLPDMTISLNSFNAEDIQKMKNKYQELRTRVESEQEHNSNKQTNCSCKWTLFGGIAPGTLFFQETSNNTHNCSSIVLEILRAGDSRSLFEYSTCSTPIISPNFVGQMITEAKTKEVYLYPFLGKDKYMYENIWHMGDQKITERETEIVNEQMKCSSFQ